MRICLLEPYATGSHRGWLDGYASASRHEITPLTLTGQFWKWRMHGGAATLASLYRERKLAPDLLLATDMLDLTTFLALTRDRTHDLPVALYMHENQLTYPPRPGETPDLHYAFINYASMLCADSILFNSLFHLESWYDELPRLLKHFPDHNELSSVAALLARSEVLPLGLRLRELDRHRPRVANTGAARILWNHRWEYDKGPTHFLAALYELADRGLEFEVAFLGESFVRVPPEFEEARDRLSGRIVQFGFVESAAEYAKWLWCSDIVVSTAVQEFFGAAIVEAMYCDCLPILPHRLAYPALIPPEHRARCLYDDKVHLLALLEQAIHDIEATRAVSLRSAVMPYDWGNLAPKYDQTLADVAIRRSGRTEGRDRD